MKVLEQCINELSKLITDIQLVCKENQLQISSNHERIKDNVIQLIVSDPFNHTILINLSLNGDILVEIVNFDYSLGLNQYCLDKVRFTADASSLFSLITVIGTELEFMTIGEFTSLLLTHFNIIQD